MSYSWDEDRNPEPSPGGLTNEEWEARFGQSNRRAAKWVVVIELLIFSFWTLLSAFHQAFF